LGPVTRDAVRTLVELEVSMAVTSVAGLQDAEAAAKAAGKQAKVHIKVDTGMGRIGFRSGQELGEALEALANPGHIEIEGLFSHFAAADTDPDYTRMQLKRFRSEERRVGKE